MVHNKPIQVVVFTLMGPEMQTKYILRCRNCRLNERDHLNPAMEDHRQDVWYHPDMVKLKVNSFINMQICTHFQYGNVKNGWAHYKKHEATLVKSSNVVFFTPEMVNNYASLLHHGWLSQEGQSEAYNETHRNSPKVGIFKDFLIKNPNVGKQFAKKVNQSDSDMPIPFNDDYNDGQCSNTMFEMHRKNVSQALYSKWIREELKDRHKVGKVLFGPRYDAAGKLITYQDSVESFLTEVDELRTNEIYPHEECTGTEKGSISH